MQAMLTEGTGVYGYIELLAHGDTHGAPAYGPNRLA